MIKRNKTIMTLSPQLVIQRTAEAILNGMDPKQLVENPLSIFSENMKKIAINLKDDGIKLYESDIELLKNKGLSFDNYEWHNSFGFKNDKLRYIKYDQRDNEILVQTIINKELDGFAIYEVPIEEWTWEVKYMKKKNGGSEYIDILI